MANRHACVQRVCAFTATAEPFTCTDGVSQQAIQLEESGMEDKTKENAQKSASLQEAGQCDGNFFCQRQQPRKGTCE